ncbi:MAG TPA: exodeoxyribonuclease VII large subunit [Caulobacteraceae bacterium]|nr:exodeoxyribonuclease VII large subunit [Caulobacteraceae bacterium]
MDDQALAPEPNSEASNAPTWSVSELSTALKRTLEDAFSFVRLRGEVSKITFHASGHVYLDIKDDKACISGVIFRREAAKLQIRPQTGMEVIVSGRITTYPGRSQYQIIVDTLAPAGVGALLAQLEKLKAKLAGEGLFAPERKRPLPAMPQVIGVITSPTGAVIRDILHRVAERWPCRVVVWPVVVQGETAAAQARAAIQGFAALSARGVLPRPDVLIVARGGGSVEDLWPFNDEALARAAAASPIPLVSAVGHETDWTLIDWVADRRAPTPSAAAEIVTPVLDDLLADVAAVAGRLARRGERVVKDRRDRLAAAAAVLPRARHQFELARQTYANLAERLPASLQRNVDAHDRRLAGVAALVRPEALRRVLRVKGEQLAAIGGRLRPCMDRRMETARQRLATAEALWRSLDIDAPLSRGFARVLRSDGRLARTAAELRSGEAVRLKFADGDRGARIDGVSTRGKPVTPDQGDLF